MVSYWRELTLTLWEGLEGVTLCQVTLNKFVLAPGQRDEDGTLLSSQISLLRKDLLALEGKECSVGQRHKEFGHIVKKRLNLYFLVTLSRKGKMGACYVPSKA